MKFQVEAVLMSRLTRRRCGKSFRKIIDTVESRFYGNTQDPSVVERLFEMRWDLDHPGSHTDAKVVDVREV